MVPPTRPRRPTGRPARISRDLIVEAASSAENLDTLTMRELAVRLDVSHGALYHWVKNREELFDLVSDVLVDRVVTSAQAADESWRPRLARIAWLMHDEFLALPGYCAHLARPHHHNAHAADRLHHLIHSSFLEAGIGNELAEQSYYIFITSTLSWLAFEENSQQLGSSAPRFDVFVEALLRGLPAREPSVSAALE